MEATLGILLVNLLPVASVLMFGWNALTLLILYWLENVIIGLFNAVKMLIAGIAMGRDGTLAALGLIPFFVFHYGLFCAVHGAFILAMFGGIDNLPDADPFNLPATVMRLVASNRMMAWNLALLGAFQAYLFLRFWVAPKKWRGTDPARQMLEPYGRIVVVHLTIMICAIPVLLLGQPVIAVAVLAVLKTMLETGTLNWARAKDLDNFDLRRAIADVRAGRNPG